LIDYKIFPRKLPEPIDPRKPSTMKVLNLQPKQILKSLLKRLQIINFDTSSNEKESEFDKSIMQIIFLVNEILRRYELYFSKSSSFYAELVNFHKILVSFESSFIDNLMKINEFYKGGVEIHRASKLFSIYFNVNEQN
jgi:hypothetical protein